VRVTVQPSFYAKCDELRRQFEAAAGPSRDGAANRFVWDYWHIPDQYTYFRTLALNVIPPGMLADFTAELRAWGLAHLGTSRATVPWLSFYVDGCRQEIHSDVVQGMWSYVYSLTPWGDRQFSGGETLLGAELLLDYWRRFDPDQSTESRHLVDKVPAEYNQLCVFDSRLPHGVATVQGTRHPLQGRVALHGWFLDPEPSVDGPLPLQEILAVVMPISATTRAPVPGRLLGRTVWRLEIEADGRVDRASLVVHNLVAPDDEEAVERLVASQRGALESASLPAADGRSTALVLL
jgi:hypothetical protein